MAICYLSNSFVDGISHTWLSTWTSRGTCVSPTIYYLSVYVPMGFLPYLAENLDEQRYLGKSVVSVSQSSLPLKEEYVLFSPSLP